MTPPDSARLDAIESFFKEPVWGKPCGAAHLQADRLGLDACAIARRFEADLKAANASLHAYKVEEPVFQKLREAQARVKELEAFESDARLTIAGLRVSVQQTEKERDAARASQAQTHALMESRLALIEDLKRQAKEARAEAASSEEQLRRELLAHDACRKEADALRQALENIRDCDEAKKCYTCRDVARNALTALSRPSRGEAICIDRGGHEAHWVNLDEYRREYCSGKAPLGSAGTAKAETGMFVKKRIPVRADKAIEPGYIETLEGKMRVERGDWIVTGVRGEKYPVKADIFAETYEPAAEASAACECVSWGPPVYDAYLKAWFRTGLSTGTCVCPTRKGA